jgi:hypothetical protein
MTPTIPCPYCGCVGYHTWFEDGGCPGAVSERERDAVAALYLRTLTEENLKLQFAIGRYVILCGKAAEALAGCTWQERDDLIAELRKATE